MTLENLRQALEEARPRERRERMLMVRMTPDEKARIDAAAERQGMPAATLARVLIFTGLDELQVLEEGGVQARTDGEG